MASPRPRPRRRLRRRRRRRPRRRRRRPAASSAAAAAARASGAARGRPRGHRRPPGAAVGTVAGPAAPPPPLAPPTAAALAGRRRIALVGGARSPARGPWSRTSRRAGAGAPGQRDPRADLAEFVEDKGRGLEFDHPVYVDFLTADEYTEQHRGRADVTDEEREELDRYAGELRAGGRLRASSTCSPPTTRCPTPARSRSTPRPERITVRGTEMSVGLEVTLAHELAHALQDQHFDLDRLRGDAARRRRRHHVPGPRRG